MTPLPKPNVTETSKPYWDALAEGRLAYQSCKCGNRWLPARRHCPKCLSTDVEWKTASGQAKLVSWVVFHKPPHEAFEGRTPYNVSIVELEEGPRMLTNVDDARDGKGLQIGQKLKLAIHREDDLAIARFVRA